MMAAVLAPAACKKTEPVSGGSGPGTAAATGSAGATATPGSAGPPPAAQGGDQLEGQLDIIAWPGYIERG
jgi:hypothetical protein